MKKVNLGRKVDLGRKVQLFQDRFKTCFDIAKSKISQIAAIPAKKYGFTKQKHIRGDKTLKILNFSPNVVYFGLGTTPNIARLTIGRQAGPAKCISPPPPPGDHIPRCGGDQGGIPEGISQPVDPSGVGGL